MFYKIPSLIAADASLSLAESKVLLGIFDHCRPDKLQAWPGLEAICDAVGWSFKSVSRASRTISSLASKGWLQVTHRRGSNIYHITPPQHLIEAREARDAARHARQKAKRNKAFGEAEALVCTPLCKATLAPQSANKDSTVTIFQEKALQLAPHTVPVSAKPEHCLEQEQAIRHARQREYTKTQSARAAEQAQLKAARHEAKQERLNIRQQEKASAFKQAGALLRRMGIKGALPSHTETQTEPPQSRPETLQPPERTDEEVLQGKGISASGAEPRAETVEPTSGLNPIASLFKEFSSSGIGAEDPRRKDSYQSDKYKKRPPPQDNRPQPPLYKPSPREPMSAESRAIAREELAKMKALLEDSAPPERPKQLPDLPDHVEFEQVVERTRQYDEILRRERLRELMDKSRHGGARDQ